jgi:hypothetical protein
VHEGFRFVRIPAEKPSRYQGKVSGIYFRADAAFAMPRGLRVSGGGADQICDPATGQPGSAEQDRLSAHAPSRTTSRHDGLDCRHAEHSVRGRQTACVGQNITRHLGQTTVIQHRRSRGSRETGASSGGRNPAEQHPIPIHPLGAPWPPRSIQGKMLIAISESRRPRRNSVRYPVNAG